MESIISGVFAFVEKHSADLKIFLNQSLSLFIHAQTLASPFAALVLKKKKNDAKVKNIAHRCLLKGACDFHNEIRKSREIPTMEKRLRKVIK